MNLKAEACYVFSSLNNISSLKRRRNSKIIIFPLFGHTLSIFRFINIEMKFAWSGAENATSQTQHSLSFVLYVGGMDTYACVQVILGIKGFCRFPSPFSSSQDLCL